jgi:hypothetical protein
MKLKGNIIEVTESTFLDGHACIVEMKLNDSLFFLHLTHEELGIFHPLPFDTNYSLCPFCKQESSTCSYFSTKKQQQELLDVLHQSRTKILVEKNIQIQKYLPKIS